MHHSWCIVIEQIGGIELGCTEGCTKDMSAKGCAENGDAGCLTGVAGPDGLRSVNSS